MLHDGKDPVGQRSDNINSKRGRRNGRGRGHGRGRDVVVKGGAEKMAGETGGGCSGTVLKYLLINISNSI